MSFEIKGKVALISGGGSGIGLRCAKELLRNGLKGVTLAEVNKDAGQKAVKELQDEFGPNKVVFVQTDVTNMQNYEEAFKKTTEIFKNLDILINNAGIANDHTFDREIDVNVKGVVHGVLLGLENYIPKYKSGPEGVIVNISSVAGTTPFCMMPIYTGTKFAVLGMTKAFGDEAHHKRTKIRVLALCPGVTQTPLMAGVSSSTLGPAYQKLFEEQVGDFPSQDTESVALAMIKIVKNAKTGTAWIAEGGQDPYEFVLPPRESFAPK
jgi:15-hydroxyprostaglandin dehydrogenase (NAD)